MAGRTFFPRESWIGKVIDFEEVDDDANVFSRKWQIEEILDERHEQGDKVEWEDFGKTPMMAIALFNCLNHNDPSQFAFMKVYKQIPYIGSEFSSPSIRASQASPDTEIREEIALSTLTQKGSKSSPPLLNSKREIQDNNSGLIPGGFIVYLVTEPLPGKLLDVDDYWKLTYDERAEIRLAFQDAYKDCFNCGFVQTEGFLGTSLLWDEDSKKIFILGFGNGERATADNAWDDLEWLFLALLDASSIDYAAIAERLGQGHTRDTVYQRIYNPKNGRVKNFVMSTPGSNTSPTKKRKMDTESNEKSD